jgi:acyl dehydratase
LAKAENASKGVRYWEDFKAGEVEEIGGKHVDKEEIIAFARQYDPQPFHVDEAAAKQSMYGGLIASGWHTCAMVMRMMCDTYMLQSASVGSPGIDNLKWLKPVRPGDTISARRTTLETRASKSKLDIGIVNNLWEVFNQDGEMVMSMQGYGMFRRRNPGSPAT